MLRTMDVKQWKNGWRGETRKGRFRSIAETRWRTTLITCWVIWKAKCEMVFQYLRPGSLAVIRNVRKMINELHSLQQPNPTPHENTDGMIWERPSQGIIKINCDATWCSLTRRATSSSSRNHNTEVVEGFHGSEVVDNAEYLEARYVYEGIRLVVKNI